MSIKLSSCCCFEITNAHNDQGMSELCICMHYFSFFCEHCERTNAQLQISNIQIVLNIALTIHIHLLILLILTFNII